MTVRCDTTNLAKMISFGLFFQPVKHVGHPAETHFDRGLL
jgi:hypothetical protein